MTEGLADVQGRPTRELIKLYDLWSASGAGLLIGGNAAVDARHLERPGNIIMEDTRDEHRIAMLREWTSVARQYGAGFWLQLSHAGRQTPALVNPKPKAPSAIPLAIPGKQFGMPVALTEDEILAIIDRFARAAELSRDVGFSGVQLHAAHGYLISQFLSPLANRRGDAWGGTPENRARFLLETVRAVRHRVGTDFTVAVKLNSADFQRGGLDPESSAQVAGWLELAGVDLIEVSGGNYEQPSMFDINGTGTHLLHEDDDKAADHEPYFLQHALAIQRRVKTPIVVTGGFRSVQVVEAALASGLSGIGFARPLVIDPHALQRLYQGDVRIDDQREHLRFGSGWLGPQSRFKFIRGMNAFGALCWQYQRIRNLGAGLPQSKTGLLLAIWREMKAQRAWMANYNINASA